MDPQSRPLLGLHPSLPTHILQALTVTAWRNRCFALRVAHTAGECPDSSRMSDLVMPEFSSFKLRLLPAYSLFFVCCVWQDDGNNAIGWTRAIREVLR